MLVRIAQLITAAIVGILLYNALPFIEGKIAPVLINTEVTDIRPNGDYGSFVYGRFDKARDCNFISLEWFYGRPDNGFVAVESKLIGESPEPKRPFATYNFFASVNLTPEQVLGNSFVKLTYSCHGQLFWNTVWIYEVQTSRELAQRILSVGTK